MFANPRAMSAPDDLDAELLAPSSRIAREPLTPSQKLYEAANERDLEAAKQLLDDGTDPDGYIDEAMGTALHRASDLGDEAMATLLLDHGANINARAPALRSTPLMGAAVSGNLRMMDLLLRRGANPKLRDSEGECVRAYPAPEHIVAVGRHLDEWTAAGAVHADETLPAAAACERSAKPPGAGVTRVVYHSGDNSLEMLSDARPLAHQRAADGASGPEYLDAAELDAACGHPRNMAAARSVAAVALSSVVAASVLAAVLAAAAYYAL